MEYWQQIDGFPNYEVSDLGRFRSAQGRLLTLRPNDDGYMEVRLWRDGKRHLKIAHVIVARHWLDTEPLETVNHKDLNKANNRADNLEWMTRVDNLRHGWRSGANNYHFKVPAQTICLMAELHEAGMSQGEIAKLFEVHIVTVNRYMNGRQLGSRMSQTP